LVQENLDIGVLGGSELISFAEALIGADKLALDKARAELKTILGQDSVTAASAVAANFSKNDRIANGLGIPHNQMMLKATKDVRQQLDLDKYLSAHNSLKYFPSD
jgi:hypothetical protein